MSDTNNIGIKEDCFALKAGYITRCEALNELYCRKEVCKFYKPKEQYIKEIMEAEKRKG